MIKGAWGPVGETCLVVGEAAVVSTDAVHSFDAIHVFILQC